jgi:uncharacterized protein YggE
MSCDEEQIFRGVLTMKKTFCMFAVLFALAGEAQLKAQENQKPAISVSSTGKARAKPDVAVVFLNIKSTAPLAADALSQNSKKVEEAKTRLAALGYKDDQVKFSGNRFSPAGGGMFYGGQRPTGFDVYNFVFVYLDGPELKDVNQLNSKVSAVLDEMGKVGASPNETPISRFSLGGASVVAFTVKDPSAFEKEAYVQAMDKSRPIADDIARRMKVQITGIDSVTSVAQERIQEQFPNPVDELAYQYFSSSMEEVPIRVSLTVRYTYK